jgi:hypothetical protein
MTIEKTIERLKKLHEKYTAQVQSLTAQRDQINERLAEASARALQTADAVASLEGKPTMTQLLKDALVEYHAPNPEHVGDVAKLSPIPENVQSDLPPAEPGFHWAKNEFNEDVLVPDNIPEPIISTLGGGITLPAIGEDFSDNPEDLIQ